MKPIFIIFFSFFFFKTFGQIDSQLQRLIDSAKAQQQSNRSTTKDSLKKPAIKKTAKEDSILPESLRPDSTRLTAPGLNIHPAEPAKTDSIKKVAKSADSVVLINRSSTIQPGDSLKQDSLKSVMASLIKKPLAWQQDTAFVNLLRVPIAKTNLLFRDGDFRIPRQKDYLFYLLVGVILFLAVIKQLFPRYFQNLFRLLFQASFRQKQTREQMMQEVFPSLLMNILFVLVGGVFIALLADIYQWLNMTFWWITIYSITLLALIYMMKYIGVKLMGWIFNAQDQASTYGFIVFFANKVMGIALLPLVLLIAFSEGTVRQIAITLAAFVIIVLLVFRYIISLTIIRSTLSIHPLHFFIYLCGVELLPILIIYKILFNYIGKST